MTQQAIPQTFRRLITVIVPVFNEEDNVDRCYAAVSAVFDRVADAYDLEILFSDNHSSDATFARLSRLAQHDQRVRVVRLARNFGFQRSLLGAYRIARGDAAVQLDCDLQDPPELIPAFLERWQAGHDVVVGIRAKRAEPWALQAARRAFYRLIKRISDDGMIENAGDFRLVDRSVMERLRMVQDTNPYTRGLISAFAAQQVGIPYERAVREFGQSKFPVRRLFGFAIDGIIAHSIMPLRLATWIGAGVFLLAFCLLLYYFTMFAVSGGDWPEGFATLTLLLLASTGLNGVFLGTLGEYIGRIYNEVRVRPLSVVERCVNLDPAEVEKAINPQIGQR